MKVGKMRHPLMACFGTPGLPVSPDVKVVQVDISAEEIGNNVPAAVGLVGDVKAVSAQLADAVIASKWKFAPTSAWWTDLRAKV
jgi:2-hydroxyacyl-CoA lyase 1